MKTRTLGTAAILAATVLLTATAEPALAQENRFELTPVYGQSFLGGFGIDDYEFGRLDLELEDASIEGLAIGIPIGKRSHIELFWAEQATTFGFDSGPFLPIDDLGGMDVAYYHVGYSWTMPLGQVRPFFLVSAGITELDPSGDFLLDTESEFSAGFGGGVKIFWTERLGLRLDLRLLVTDTVSDACCYGCCYDENAEDLLQAFVTAGLVFAF